MDQAMVVLTEERQVVEIGLAAVAFPPADVMRIDEGRVSATGEAAMSVSAPEFSALSGGRISASPAFVHRVAYIVVEGHDERGVTGQAPCDHGVDESTVLELAGQVRILGERRQRHVGDDKVRTGDDLFA
jgi:hypothetical protein